MLCSEIITQIEKTYPKEAALGFDNVGLLAGRGEKEGGSIDHASSVDLFRDEICDRSGLYRTQSAEIDSK